MLHTHCTFSAAQRADSKRRINFTMRPWGIDFTKAVWALGFRGLMSGAFPPERCGAEVPVTVKRVRANSHAASLGVQTESSSATRAVLFLPLLSFGAVWDDGAVSEGLMGCFSHLAVRSFGQSLPQTLNPEQTQQRPTPFPRSYSGLGCFEDRVRLRPTESC